MAPADKPHPLDSLDARIKAARAARTPEKSQGEKKFTAASLAWRMVTDLTVGILVGGAMGWGLDSLLGTLPLFLIVMGLFGFAAGVRLVLRAATEMREKQEAEGRAPGPGTDEGGR